MDVSGGRHGFPHAHCTSSPTLRVLIADTYADVADSLAQLLRAWGLGAGVAYSGQSALELALTSSPDVVIAEFGLLTADRTPLDERLRAERPDLLLIALTTDSRDPRNPRQSGDAPTARFLKGSDPEDLRRLLARAARKHAGAGMALDRGRDH